MVCSYPYKTKVECSSYDCGAEVGGKKLYLPSLLAIQNIPTLLLFSKMSFYF